MKKRRRFITIAVIVAIVLFAIYQFITPPITYKIDSRLVEINDTLKTLSEEHGLDSMIIYPSSSRTKNPEVRDIIPPEVYSTARRLDIKAIYFQNRPEPTGKSVDYIADRFFSFLRPSWYYLYSESGFFEEEIVPSVEEAVKQHRGAPYYGFCQEAEVPNWFYCTHDSGG